MQVVGGVGLPNDFFLSFWTGDGLGFIRFCSWDVSEGGGALGSGGLGGGLGWARVVLPLEGPLRVPPLKGTK